MLIVKEKMKVVLLLVISITATTLCNRAFSATQDNWRQCKKCKGLFYNGYANKGVCPAGGAHVSNQAGNYTLIFDTPTAGQNEWRYCTKCHALFYNGYPNKGVCPAGQAHVAAGYNFDLPYGTGVGEHNWRFCNKCESLFYNGVVSKGVCKAGGGHVAAGYNFVLKFRGNLSDDVQLNPVHD
jgi:hypothetical protein